MRCLNCQRKVVKIESDNCSCPCEAVFENADLEYEFDKKLYDMIVLWKKEMGITDSPMDGDETLELTTVIQAKIDYCEGNITANEYHDIIVNAFN